MKFKCVEPALVHDASKANTDKDTFVGSTVYAKQGDEITYPHVDSCLTATLVLDDGSVAATHIGMMKGDDMRPTENAYEALDEILLKVGSWKVEKILLIGDGSWGPGGCNVRMEFAKRGNCNNTNYMNSDGLSNGGVDITLVPQSGRYTVSASRGGKFAEGNLSTVKGHMNKKL